MLSYRVGDLFESTDLDALAHGCNCVGAADWGIHVSFAHRYPEMIRIWKEMCRRDQFHLGDAWAWQAEDGRWIYNLGTQKWTSPDARPSAIEESVRKMLVHASQHEVATIGLPKIGSVLGGLDWDMEVEPAIQRAIDTAPGVQLIVHQLSAEQQKGKLW